MSYVNVTNYIMHIELNEELFIDFASAAIKNPRYFHKEKYLRININDEDIFFQTETKESRTFIKTHFGIDIPTHIGGTNNG